MGKKDATSKKIQESETRVPAAYPAHLIAQHPVLIQRLRTSRQVRTTGVAHFWGQWLSLTLPLGSRPFSMSSPPGHLLVTLGSARGPPWSYMGCSHPQLRGP